MSDSKQTVLESLVNRAKHLGNIKAAKPWRGGPAVSSLCRLRNQLEQGERAFLDD